MIDYEVANIERYRSLLQSETSPSRVADLTFLLRREEQRLATRLAGGNPDGGGEPQILNKKK